jgi:hypothetical protein
MIFTDLIVPVMSTLRMPGKQSGLLMSSSQTRTTRRASGSPSMWEQVWASLQRCVATQLQRRMIHGYRSAGSLQYSSAAWVQVRMLLCGADLQDPMNPQYSLRHSNHPLAPFPGEPLKWSSFVYDDGTT